MEYIRQSLRNKILHTGDHSYTIYQKCADDNTITATLYHSQWEKTIEQKDQQNLPF